MSETPKKGYRNIVLLLLTLVYGFNFIDRQIVGILAPFIQADLDLSNTELGLLIGLAFAAFYTILGIPLAFLADKMNRVTLLSLYGSHRFRSKLSAYRARPCRRWNR